MGRTFSWYFQLKLLNIYMLRLELELGLRLWCRLELGLGLRIDLGSDQLTVLIESPSFFWTPCQLSCWEVVKHSLTHSFIHSLNNTNTTTTNNI